MGVGRLTPSFTIAVPGRSATASVGSMTGSGVSVPTPSEDTWTKISTDFAIGDARNGPKQPFHHRSVVYPHNGYVWVSWRFPVDQFGVPNPTIQGTFTFDPIAGYWTRLNMEPADYPPFDQDPRGDYALRNLGQRENYGAAYDADRNWIWLGTGTPDGWSGSGFYTAPNCPTYGDAYYVVADDTVHLYAPMPDNLDFGRTDLDAFTRGNDCVTYFNGYVWVHGRYGLKRRNLGTNGVDYLINDINAQAGAVIAPEMLHNFPGVAGFNATEQYLWFLDARQELFTCDISGPGPYSFVHVITTGSRPPFNEYVSGRYENGTVASIDEKSNVLVAYIHHGTTNAAFTGMQIWKKTWVLDLTTNAWRDGPSVANGDTIPNSPTNLVSACALQLLYDPFYQRCVLTFPKDDRLEVWTFKPRFASTWSWFPIPISTGAIYGVNYYGFPFTVQNSSGQAKNVNMAYCPLNNRLYASGGDCKGTGSDTPGCWSMDLTDGSWRLDSGLPNSGTPWAYPQPNGYQDWTGFWWSSARNKFIFGFSCSESYEEQNVSANWQYARGIWFFDPTLYPTQSAWTQDLTLMEDKNGPFTMEQFFERPETGCAWGGCYDEQTDTVYVAPNGSVSNGQSLGSLASFQKYHVATWAKTMSAQFRFPPRPAALPTGNLSVYYTESKPQLIGRDIFWGGYYTDGSAARVWRIIRWNIDTETLVGYYDFPNVTHRSLQLSGLFLEKSNGKIVWINVGYPEGDVVNIYALDITSGTWIEDTSRPTVGRLYAGCTASLPDNRIVMCGAQFNSDGGQVTHIYFYRAP